ncbi:MAG TPA: tol-pal system protein YbgF [Bryobacteraceae bacterium]|jgi:tol-pal system protein YbgF|nr:tol-pal system protein YbgF [Bryobacteraceae bacterium]
MKFLRLGILALAFSPFCFAVNKDIVQLQRDMQDRINALQNDIDSKLSTLTGILTAMQADTRRTADQVAGLQDVVNNGISKSLAPVGGLSTQVNTMGDDVRSLKDAIADLSARLERMDAKMTDLKNQLQIIQNPPSAPGATTPGGPGTPGSAGGTAAGQSGPPAGMSADKSYTDAVRDLQTGKTDLAYNEFQQYLTYFPNTELAANAQYYLGEINYNRGDYNGAITAFDAVLERYPENPKTPDAHLMKAMALLKSNQRNRAVQEFRVLVENYPHTDDARKALQQLRALGASSASSSTTRRK